MPVVSIIIVNYYSGAVLRDCLLSVYEKNTDVDKEVIVVNNSPDDTNLDAIKKEFPLLNLLETGYNAGFSRANNLGIEAATGTYILLLNSDTVLPEGILHYVSTWMDAHPDFAGVGATLIYPNGETQISGNYVMRGGLNYLMMIPFFGGLIKVLGKLANVRKPNLSAVEREVAEVDWINGAFLWVRASVLPASGLLDPDFFLYHEESEWCSRLKKHGKLGILGKFPVVHIEGYSSNQAFQSKTKGHNSLFDKKGKQLFLSLMVRLRKEFGLFWALFHLLVFTISLPIVLLLGCIWNLLQWVFGQKTVSGNYGHYALNVLYPWRFLNTLCANTPCFYKAD
jgi:GT2 family glycosyltransferase